MKCGRYYQIKSGKIPPMTALHSLRELYAVPFTGNYTVYRGKRLFPIWDRTPSGIDKGSNMACRSYFRKIYGSLEKIVEASNGVQAKF